MTSDGSNGPKFGFGTSRTSEGKLGKESAAVHASAYRANNTMEIADDGSLSYGTSMQSRCRRQKSANLLGPLAVEAQLSDPLRATRREAESTFFAPTKRRNVNSHAMTVFRKKSL